MKFNPDTDESSYFDVVANMEQMMNEQDAAELQSLIEEISKYDVFDFISRVAALNLLIENQNKSILLDALIAGLLTDDADKYKGTAQMSSGKFRNIIARLEKFSLGRMLDPAENPFIERIRYYGNYWIFPGIDFTPAYCFQGFLNVLCLGNMHFDKKFVKKAHVLINFVLTLSNLIAERLEYDLNCVNHVEVSGIHIPPLGHFKLLQESVCIDNNLLEQMVPDEQIWASLFSEFGIENPAEVINSRKHAFYEHPFLKHGDVSVLLNPSILVPFAIHQLILLAGEYGHEKVLVDEYNNEIWKQCKNSMKQLGCRIIDAAQYGIDLANNEKHKEMLFATDIDEIIILQFACDDGSGYGSQSMLTSTRIDISTYERTQYFLGKLPRLESKQLFQIIVMNGFGRELEMSQNKREAKYTIQVSPYELYCIAANEADRDCFLQKYIRAKGALTQTPNNSISSELNRMELYVHNGYSFYFSDKYAAENTSIIFAPGDSLDYIIRAVKKEDRQLLEYYDGIHLMDVVLADKKRPIYKPKEKTMPTIELAVKLNGACIWIVTDPVTCQDEMNAYVCVVDTISYWLAEAREILNNITVKNEVMCLYITFENPVGKYYKKQGYSTRIQETLHYSHDNNVIRMIWSAEAYGELYDDFGTAEAAMMMSVFKELGCHSCLQPDYKALELLFGDPLKRKIYAFAQSDEPYLIPTYRNMYTISEEEVDRLLDEIGRHCLSLPECENGFIKKEDRSKIANEVVSHLYSELQSEVACLNVDGLFERIIMDLETLLFQELTMNRRYAYDLSCYPENVDLLLKQFKKANQTSLSLKFLAEYVASVPPEGNEPLTNYRYDRILAVCNQIIEWAYKNDLFFYDIISTPLVLLESKRLGMSRRQVDHLADINDEAIIHQMAGFSNPNVEDFSSLNLLTDYLPDINAAFEDEYGYTLQQFYTCIEGIAECGELMCNDTKRAPRDYVVSTVTNKTELPESVVVAVLDHITLRQRENYLKPPEPYTKLDVYPWRFNRALSLTRRPVIQYGNELIWGNRQLHHMVRHLVNLLLEGKLEADKAKLKEIVGRLSNKRGDRFNMAVAQKLGLIDGLIVETKVSKINGKKISDNNRMFLGDVDILCIIPDKRTIIVGEAKDFSMAKNPYEMRKEYENIFVDKPKELCYISKHKRRVKWVINHLDDVKAHFRLPDGKWKIKNALFVSKPIISNSFYHKKETVIVYTDITEKLIKSI